MADNTFKNVSDQVYVDGDLVIRPGETVTDVNEDRAAQFRGMYSWQFQEASASKSAKSEAEIRQESRDYQHPVAPINDQSQVEMQVEDGETKVESPTKGEEVVRGALSHMPNKSHAEQTPSLTNKDVLASHGLVQIYDASVGAYRQVPREEAERMVAALEETKKSLEDRR